MENGGRFSPATEHQTWNKQTEHNTDAKGTEENCFVAGVGGGRWWLVPLCILVAVMMLVRRGACLVIVMFIVTVMVIVTLALHSVSLRIKHALVHLRMRFLPVQEIRLSQHTVKISPRFLEILFGFRCRVDPVIGVFPVLVVVLVGTHVDILDATPLTANRLPRRHLDVNAWVMKLRLKMAHAPNVRAVDGHWGNIANNTTLILHPAVVVPLVAPNGRVDLEPLDVVQTPIILRITTIRFDTFLLVRHSLGVLMR